MRRSKLGLRKEAAMAEVGGLCLQGLERAIIFNRWRAAVGLRYELARLLEGVPLLVESRLC